MSIFLRTDAELAARFDRLRDATEIAVDTEFHPERTYFPKPLLIQLRPDQGEVMLIDATTIADLRPLAVLLCEKPLLVHGGAADIGILHRLAGRSPSQVYDTQVAAGFAGIGYPKALRDLTAAVLNRAIDKTESLTDWARRPLSIDQLRYAAEDVLVLAPLVAALRERITIAGYQAEFSACMAERVARWTSPPDDRSAWRRMHSGHLTDEERGALCALAEWRERSARDANVPAHSILSDGMLQDVARRRPRSIEQLRDNRRMPSGAWKSHGEAILRVLAEAAKTPPPEALARGLLYDLARLAARVAEAQSGVSADLVFVDCEMDYIFREKLESDWRTVVLGPEWGKFIGGTVSISMPGRWT